jgi:hypothetical protein
MGSNAFTKEEKVLFAEQVVEAEDALSTAGLIDTKRMDLTDQQRGGDSFWIPRPYIQTSHDGLDQSANFAGKVQLSVPIRVNNMKSANSELDGLELRDALQEKRLFKSGLQKLASDINLSVINTINRWGSLFIAKTGASTGFDEVADVATLLDQNGVPAGDRCLLMNPRDYRGAAGELSKASRSLIGDISTKALRQAYVGELAGIDTFRQQYTKNLAAAAGGAGLTMSTLVAGGNVYVPAATSDDGDGLQNIDSRKQQVTLSSNTSVAVGDRFTLADVYNVHPITKESTGELKSFVVVEIPAGSATDIVISPPFISDLSTSEGGQQYQNCYDASPAANTAIVFLNIDDAPQNYFFHKEAICLTPSQIVMPSDAGMSMMTATLKNGIVVVALKQAAIGPAKVQYRLTARWGVTVLAPEMVGSLAFNQVP